MPANQNPLQQTYEAIDNASGGVASQVVDTVQTAVEESASQIAQTPLDILKGLIGMNDAASESSTSGSDPMAQLTGAGGQPLGQPTEFQKKLMEDREAKEKMMAQHRAMLAAYQQQHQKTKSMDKQAAQQEEVEQEQKKQVQEAEKKQQAPMWRRIVGMGGANEGAKKGF